VWLDVHTAKGC
jgi:glucan 1,3-beta-glucosidase